MSIYTWVHISLLSLILMLLVVYMRAWPGGGGVVVYIWVLMLMMGIYEGMAWRRGLSSIHGEWVCIYGLMGSIHGLRDGLAAWVLYMGCVPIYGV